MDAKNLLLIMADEFTSAHLGCAGHPLVKTPNLDKLAASGTRFRSAYTDSLLCIPARASFATGRYTHDIGYWDNAHPYDGRVPGWGTPCKRKGIGSNPSASCISAMPTRQPDSTSRS